MLSPHDTHLTPAASPASGAACCAAAGCVHPDNWAAMASAGNVHVAGDVCASGRVSGSANGRVYGWLSQWLVLLGQLLHFQCLVLLGPQVVPPAAAVVVVAVAVVVLGAPAAVVVVVAAAAAVAAAVVAASDSVVDHCPQVLGQDSPPPECRNAKCRSRLSGRYSKLHLIIKFSIQLVSI